MAAPIGPAPGPVRRSGGVKWLGPLLLAGVLTAALTYASLALPRWVAGLASRWIAVPDLHPAIEPDAIEALFAAHHLRAIGWTAMASTLALIVVGLVMRRRTPALLGAVVLWLPAFGAFATAMFFLAGLGVLRVLWLPIWPSAMAFGDVAYLPYLVVVWPAWQLGLDVRGIVTVAAIAGGLGVFVAATATWLRARWSGQVGLLTGGVYRVSRHPQYLGWIMWTYGMTLLAARQPVPMAGRNPGAMLAWVVSSLVIIGVALAEERHLLDRYGDAERAYRRRTPLLLPLPRSMRRLLAGPLRATGVTDPAASRWRLVGGLVLVLIVVAVLSLPFALADWPPGPSPWATWPAG